jgi:hypothetical protein
MTYKSAEGATEELRSKVKAVLFRLLRSNGTEITDETEEFAYEFTGEIGSVEIFFRIDAGFFDWAIRTSKALLDRRFQQVTDTLIAENKIRKNPSANRKDEYPQHEEHDAETAGLFAYLAMQGMKNKLRSAFYELGLETETVFEGFAQTATKYIEERAGLGPPSIADGVRALSKTMADERKRFMMASIKAFGKPQLGRLPELYPKLLKVWQSAKKIYEGNGEIETWRDMVKVKYPEFTFDDDLLTRVTGKVEELPEEIQAKLAETGGDHTPSTIALEHAARLCGADHYQYGVRHYHNLKTEQKRDGVIQESTEFD